MVARPTVTAGDPGTTAGSLVVRNQFGSSDPFGFQVQVVEPTPPSWRSVPATQVWDAGTPAPAITVIGDRLALLYAEPTTGNLIYAEAASAAVPDSEAGWTRHQVGDARAYSSHWWGVVDGVPVALYRSQDNFNLNVATARGGSPATPADWDTHTVPISGIIGAALSNGRLGVLHFDPDRVHFRLALATVAHPRSASDWVTGPILGSSPQGSTFPSEFGYNREPEIAAIGSGFGVVFREEEPFPDTRFLHSDHNQPIAETDWWATDLRVDLEPAGLVEYRGGPLIAGYLSTPSGSPGAPRVVFAPAPRPEPNEWTVVGDFFTPPPMWADSNIVEWGGRIAYLSRTALSANPHIGVGRSLRVFPDDPRHEWGAELVQDQVRVSHSGTSLVVFEGRLVIAYESESRRQVHLAIAEGPW